VTTFLMTWNPDSIHGWGFDALEREGLKPFRKNGFVELSWRLAPPYKAEVGDTAVLLKQGKRPTGIFGIGKIVEAPKIYRGSCRVKVRFTQLINPAEEFFLTEMECRELLGDALVNSRRSGREIPQEKATRLLKALKSREF
jgi:hypothetical protein